MKMQSILRLLCIAVSFLTVSALTANPSNSEGADTNSSLQPTIKKEKTVWKKVKKYLIHNRAVQNTVVPVLMKIEQIKDEGMSRRDVAQLVLYSSLAYMLFKYYRSYSLKSLDTLPPYDKQQHGAAYTLGQCEHNFTLKDGTPPSSDPVSSTVCAAGLIATLYLVYGNKSNPTRFDNETFELESLLDLEAI